jgi:hypothetical protein
MESHGKRMINHIELFSPEYTIPAGQIHITKETNIYLTSIIGGYETRLRGEIIVNVVFRFFSMFNLFPLSL